MAAPTDAARAATNITTSAGSHAINVNSPSAGDLLIVFVRFNGDPGAVTFTGYNLLVSDASDASDDTTQVYYRYANGGEGATDTMTTGNNVKLGAICWRVTGAAVQPPNISAVSVGTTTANTCQSNSVAPTLPPQDTLYITMGGEDGESGAFTGAPTNYGNLQAANSGTGGLPATNVLLGGASRQISSSSSDDAGVFTHAAATTGWTAFAVAIRPPDAFIDTTAMNVLQAVNRGATW